MRLLVLSITLCAGLSGCNLAVWYAAHHTEVLAITAIGGAAYAVEQAAGGAIDLGKKVKEVTKED